MIPLLHDFEGQTVLVFGGGRVGARKARRFAREARVVVVSPTFADGDFGDVERVRTTPDIGDVPGWIDRTEPALVVAATDDEALNHAIETAARERSILVNRADEHGERDPGSVVVPATVRDDPVTIAVATGGQSPALSRYLREEIESEFSNAGEMAELTGQLREELQERDVPVQERRAAVRAVVRSSAVWKALDSRSPKPRQVAVDVIEDVTGETL